MEVSGFDLLKMAIGSGGVLAFVVVIFKMGAFFNKVNSIEIKVVDLCSGQKEVIHAIADLRISMARLEAKFEYELPFKSEEPSKRRSEAAKKVWSKRKGQE